MKRIATGTIAGGGMALRNSRSGPTARLNRGDTPMSRPTPAPMTTATANPSSMVIVVAKDESESLRAPQLTGGWKHGLRKGQHSCIQNDADKSYRHNIGKHEVGTQRLLLSDDAVAEAFRITYHFGDDGEYKRQTKADTRTNDNWRHRCRQDDVEDCILTTETKGPADVIKPRMNSADASHGVDEHRPKHREDGDDHFGFQREAEQQEPDRRKRNPGHRSQNLDACKAVTPGRRR